MRVIACHMAWIETISKESAEGKLLQLYEAACDPTTGKLDNILSIHSLHPAGLEAHLNLYKAVMRGTKSFRKVERELVAYVVSRVNECHY